MVDRLGHQAQQHFQLMYPNAHRNQLNTAELLAKSWQHTLTGAAPAPSRRDAGIKAKKLVRRSGMDAEAASLVSAVSCGVGVEHNLVGI